MPLDELVITRAIMESYMDKFLGSLDSDVAIVGAGPAGLVCAYYLAQGGASVAIYERKLSVGGGIWGGGAMFNQVVIQEEAKRILDDMEISYMPYEKEEGYYLVDAVELSCALGLKAVRAGVKIFNLFTVVDVKVVGEEERVSGLVLSWTPVEMAGLHVDPITVGAKYVVDGTGHDAEVARVIQDKLGKRLNTPTGKVVGEKSMWAEFGEKSVPECTGEVYPGLFVIGMAATACYGTHRMGPIFGGMLLSGEKAAKMLLERLKG
ncbi:MAG: ribose 1,5-bisphosphate isomerase [Aquificota bacterium]|nr:MAG: ribose 1,5-bisphosphate isomerase [Aquificota bacterium]RLD98444.1 MAG: ribose 1,5-bisphosphate isomerase [Aquificota bacterium]